MTPLLQVGAQVGAVGHDAEDGGQQGAGHGRVGVTQVEIDHSRITGVGVEHVDRARGAARLQIDHQLHIGVVGAMMGQLVGGTDHSDLLGVDDHDQQGVFRLLPGGKHGTQRFDDRHHAIAIVGSTIGDARVHLELDRPQR
ncbi:MAG: hypothetical protein Q4D79_02195 [Propionibacteriaceae bacterium]|nr:hypothetical protein [Propionibacteriaceae bacterium]